MESQLPVPTQRNDGDEVTQNADEYEDDAGHGGEDCGGPGVVDEAGGVPLGSTVCAFTGGGVVGDGHLLDKGGRLDLHCHCSLCHKHDTSRHSGFAEINVAATIT